MKSHGFAVLINLNSVHSTNSNPNYHWSYSNHNIINHNSNPIHGLHLLP